jgi:hypothetical protein
MIGAQSENRTAPTVRLGRFGPIGPPTLALGRLAQGGLRFGDYLREFPAVISAKYEDGMFETMRAAGRKILIVRRMRAG